MRFSGLNERPQGLEVDHRIGQSRLDQGLGGATQGVGDGGTDAQQYLGLDGHAYQHIPGAKADSTLK